MKGAGDRNVTFKRLRLVQRRKALGYTQEQLAEGLGVDRSTVVRWERGETEPLPWLRPKLAQLLKVTIEELGELLLEITERSDEREGLVLVSSVPLDFSLSAERTVKVIEGFSAHDVASRRQVLVGLAVMTEAALLQPVRQWAATMPVRPVSPTARGSGGVQELEQAVRLFRRWDASGAGGLRRKAVVGQLNAVAETLREEYRSALARRLFQITAELAQLAGWMSYDQGLPGVAQRYYLLALHACREAANPELGAKVIGDMTQLSTALGNYDDSLRLVHTALYSLPRHANAFVRSELLGLESRAYAQLGSREASHAVRSAEACVEVYQQGPADETPDWIHYMTAAEVDCLAANAYIELALRAEDQRQWKTHAERAEAHTLSARRRRAEGYVRSRIFDEIRLAKVRLAQREPAESATIAIHSVDLAEPVRSALVIEWLIRFARELGRRHTGSPELRDFHDRLRYYVHLSAPEREHEVAASGGA